MSVAENLFKLRQAIEAEANRCGRPPGSVQLVAVSKTHPIEAICQAKAAGQLHFGENRVQELVPKAQAEPSLMWHLVGQLQRNKVKYIAPFVHLIHSVDSADLLAEIDKQARKVGRVQGILLQVNISSEAQKNGCTPEVASGLAQRLVQGDYPNVALKGLMGIAEDTAETQRIVSQFNSLASLRNTLAQQLDLSITSAQAEATTPHTLAELSMGMSGDWKLAVAAGATLIRIGSAVFGQRA